MAEYKALTGGEPYQALAGFQREAVQLFRGVSDSLAGVVARYADSSGVIPIQRERAVQSEAQRALDGVFTGADRRNAFAADGVTAVSAYAVILNHWLAYSVAATVLPHSRYMAARLPADMQAWYKSSTGIPRKLLVQYDPPHEWVDPNGYQLSDRIWRTDLSTRAKIDGLLTDNIRQGKSAVQISRQLEAYLNPNRAGIVTRKPYGTKGSYDAMRLGRTEITAASGRATIAASATNPFVQGIDWVLSAAHPRMDICDKLATVGMDGRRLKKPYPVNGVPRYPAHPHELCSLRPAVTADKKAVVETLRVQMQASEPPPLTPLEFPTFTEALIGAALFGLAAREFTGAA